MDGIVLDLIHERVKGIIVTRLLLLFEILRYAHRRRRFGNKVFAHAKLLLDELKARQAILLKLLRALKRSTFPLEHAINTAARHSHLLIVLWPKEVLTWSKLANNLPIASMATPRVVGRGATAAVVTIPIAVTVSCPAPVTFMVGCLVRYVVRELRAPSVRLLSTTDRCSWSRGLIKLDKLA